MKSKKGVFFTLIGILIVTLLLVYATARYGDKLSDRFPTENMRVNQITNLVTDMESRYLPAAITATSHDALEAMVDYAVGYSPSTPFTAAEFRNDFNETVLVGKIDRIPADLAADVKTLPTILDELVLAIEAAYRVEMEYEVWDVIINQEGPFMLNVTAVMNYTIETKEGVNYNRLINSTAHMSIINLRDPWYAYRPSTSINHPIQKADSFLPSSAVGIQALLDSGNYTPDNMGPSYLERFIGEEDRGPGGLNPDKLGIVSYLNPEPVSSGGVGSFSDASYADYTFHPWKGECINKPLYKIGGVPNFRVNLHFVQLLGLDVAPRGIADKLVDGSGAPSPPCRSG